MAVRRRSPQQGGTPEKVIPSLGWLFLVCGISLYVMAFQLPWFGRLCIVLGNLSLLLALGCLGYEFFLYPEKLMILKGVSRSRSNLELSIIKTSKMKDFLFQSKAVAPDPYDPRYQQFPKVEQTKSGLRIEAIGNLRQWLLSDNFRDALESFLNINGYDLSIQSAHYKDGWVNFTLIKGIKSDRIRF